MSYLLSYTWLSLLSALFAHGKRFFVPSPEPSNPGFLLWPRIATDLSIVPKEEIYGSPWERSGLFQGDILIPPGETKNTLIEVSKKWSLPIPIYLNGSDFDRTELAVIEKALTEIEEKTCVRFRQYRPNDKSFVVVRGNDKGCWSMVGRHDGGQVLHLQRPQCVQHGIVIHEFLHALGIHHQQCSPDRDDYVKIHWENILPGRDHNFAKYSSSKVTTFNLTYDYNSLMHYGEKAFSSNGKPTITPLDSEARIGQRSGMSKLDSTKVQMLYNCPKRESKDTESIEEFFYDADLDVLEDLF